MVFADNSGGLSIFGMFVAIVVSALCILAALEGILQLNRAARHIKRRLDV
jgi:hypothetical protein